MIYRALAILVAGIHLSYVAFVIAGVFLVMHFPGLLWFHLSCVAWGCGTTIMDLGCPVTPLEKRLWKLGGREPYDTGFINKYLLHSNATGSKSHRSHIILGALMGVWNIALYSILV